MTTTWIPTTNKPIGQQDLPPERKAVLLWIKEKELPFLGYLRYAAGDRDCPYWVCYTCREHRDREGNPKPFKVTHYADCLPENGPEGVSGLHEGGQV